MFWWKVVLVAYLVLVAAVLWFLTRSKRTQF
jgi:hypothetical protein